MMYILAALFFISSIVVPVFASEKADAIISFDVNVGTLHYNPLRYCDKEYINFFNTNYRKQCENNEPFLKVYFVLNEYSCENKQTLKIECIDPITFVPFKYFMNDDTIKRENDIFKKVNDVLFSFQKTVSNQKIQIQLKLQSDFGEMDPKNLLDQFKKEPRCMPGYLLNERGTLSIYVDTTALEEELCAADIIYKIGQNYGYGNADQQYAHGPESYFGKEVKVEQEKKRTDLLYSRLTKVCYGSIAMLIMYVLYKNFYVVVHQ